MAPVMRAKSSSSCQVSNRPVIPPASSTRQLSNRGVIVRSPSTAPCPSSPRAVKLATGAIARRGIVHLRENDGVPTWASVNEDRDREKISLQGLLPPAGEERDCGQGV